jgi:phosphatidylserine/phosphatidylglycerophosphate/cardiolipin synthase-like enzyme
MLIWAVSTLGWAMPNEPVYLEDSPLLSYAREVFDALPEDGDITRNNLVHIINDGHDALLLRLHLIRSARHSIDIQTFIWEDDESGRFFWYEAAQAARRGVKVRLLIDHIASAKSPEVLAWLSQVSPNLEIKYYRPVAKKLKTSLPVNSIKAVLFHGGMNQRMHNKILMVDNQVVLTGGRNYDNHYFNQSTSYNFKDRDVMVIGPITKPVLKSFNAFWNYRKSVATTKMSDVRSYMKRNGMSESEAMDYFDTSAFFGDLDALVADGALMKARFVTPLMSADKLSYLVDRPGKNRLFSVLRFWGGGPVTAELRDTVKQTRDNLVIQSPYVIVNFWAKQVFRKIRKKSPHVRIAISTNSFAAADHVIAYAANYRLRSMYIERLGFQIFEYKPDPQYLPELLPNYNVLKSRGLEENKNNENTRPPFLSIHAKSFVVDDHIAFIGTYNLDPRSYNLNTEDGFLIEDEAIARRLKEDIERDMAPENSWVIARNQVPLGDINSLFGGLSRLSPIDLWPIQNTSSFELKDGHEAVPANHKDFYINYTDIGRFPGAEGLSSNEILTSFYKTFGKILTPAL